MNWNVIALLQADAGTGAAPTGGTGWITIIMVVGMIAIFWWMSRSRKKQEAEIKDMRDNIVVGDEITTIGGIIGKVVSIKEETLIMETGRDKVRIRILKSAVRCVDVPNEAARAALAEQRKKEAEEAAKEAEEKAAAERAKKIADAENSAGKKGKKAKKDPTSTEDLPEVTVDTEVSVDDGEVKNDDGEVAN